MMMMTMLENAIKEEKVEKLEREVERLRVVEAEVTIVVLLNCCIIKSQ